MFKGLGFRVCLLGFRVSGVFKGLGKFRVRFEVSSGPLNQKEIRLRHVASVRGIGLSLNHHMALCPLTPPYGWQTPESI